MTDTPTESTAAELRRHYRRQHPLFDTYLAVVEERNGDDRPITEPFDPPHGVTNREAMQIALRRLNMPHDDVIAKMGEAFIEVLEGEIRELAVDKPTLDDVVIETLFPAAGCLPTPGDWQGEDDDEKAAVAAEIIPRLTDDMLRDLVVTAMPAVLARIIDRDEAARAEDHKIAECPWCFSREYSVERCGNLATPPTHPVEIPSRFLTPDPKENGDGTADHGQVEESTRGWTPQSSLDDPQSEAAYNRLLDKAVEKFGLGYHYDGENDTRKAMDYALDTVGRGFAAAALHHAMRALPGLTEEQFDMLNRVTTQLDLETCEKLGGADGEGIVDCEACDTSWHTCRDEYRSDETVCCAECTHEFTADDLGLVNVTPVGVTSLLDLARERQVPSLIDSDSAVVKVARFDLATEAEPGDPVVPADEDGDTIEGRRGVRLRSQAMARDGSLQGHVLIKEGADPAAASRLLRKLATSLEKNGLNDPESCPF